MNEDAKKTKQIDDYKIITALMSTNTIKEAAERVGCSERTIYSRMNNHSFMQLYNTARAEYLSGALIAMKGKVDAAVSAVSDIVSDKSADAKVRIEAAKFIVGYADRIERRMRVFEDSAMMDAEFAKTELIDKLCI